MPTQRYYPIPTDFDQLTRKHERAAKIPLEASIRQHIYLLLSTRFHEWRYHSEYGCILWEYDFDTRAQVRNEKQKIERKLKEQLIKHEKRIGDLRVKLKVSQEEIMVRGFKALQKTKERLEIQVTGQIRETNQAFQPEPFIIYFSPILTKEQP